MGKQDEQRCRGKDWSCSISRIQNGLDISKLPNPQLFSFVK